MFMVLYAIALHCHRRESSILYRLCIAFATAQGQKSGDLPPSSRLMALLIRLSTFLELAAVMPNGPVLSSPESL